MQSGSILWVDLLVLERFFVILSTLWKGGGNEATSEAGENEGCQHLLGSRATGPQNVGDRVY